jgi:ClpX C4-type zinc finger protein
MRFGFTQLRCSFCGKKDTEIAKLVAGPHVRICDECVAVASRLMSDDSPPEGGPATARAALWSRLSVRARALLHRDDGQRVASVPASS